MAISLPAGCYYQTGESAGLTDQDARTHSYLIKGPYSALETLLQELSRDDEVVSGWLLSSANLVRNPGNLGMLTLQCHPDDSEEIDGETSQVALDETWTLKSVRNDMSILAYCGPSEGANPCRERIEAWMKEPDGEIAAQDGYKDSNGETITLTGADLQVVNKIRKGIDSVMRFYPLLTKTRTYTKPPASVYENLAQIDTPAIGTSATSKEIKKPGNLDAIISSHVWLKCQDDAALMADGKHQRIESWMGLPKTDNAQPWDVNLYGTPGGARWPIPLEVL